MSTISFKPKKVTKKITSHLQDRASDVIMNRFGLTADGKRKTLEESQSSDSRANGVEKTELS